MRRFEKSDLPEVNEWRSKREMSLLPEEAVPEIGYIEPGVVAGFLYKTDSSIVMIENVVSNPDAKAMDVYTYGQILVAFLLNEAEDNGYKHIVTFSELNSVVNFLKKHGFTETHNNWSMLYTELN